LDSGQVTDDSELTITLLRSILKNNGFVKDQVIKSYLSWANSGLWMIGKNTRALFKGVSTVKGYENRISKVLNLPNDQRSQSNGAMMRCSPLALIYNNDCVIQDASITNPNNICIDCNLVYVSALRLALQGLNGMEIFNQVKTLAQTEEVKSVFAQVEKREERDIVKLKGWCLHGLWCALIVITSFKSYSEGIKWVITSQPGSDTDTNACIAGALLGAIVGFEDISSTMKYNIDLVISLNSVSTPRQEEYLLKDFYQLTEQADAFYRSQMK